MDSARSCKLQQILNKVRRVVFWYPAYRISHIRKNTLSRLDFL
nr:unnamed protein product [Callosobruchus analis]